MSMDKPCPLCPSPNCRCTAGHGDGSTLIPSLQGLQLSEGQGALGQPSNSVTVDKSQGQSSREPRQGQSGLRDEEGGALSIGASSAPPRSLSDEEPSAVEGQEDEKWACRHCTYDNWPRALKCVMCRSPRTMSTMSIHDAEAADGQESGTSMRHASDSNNRLQTFTLTHQPKQRRPRGQERRWLEACQGVVDGRSSAVEAYLAGGGSPSRQLTQSDVAILGRPSAFDVGLTLIHLALRFKQENVLDRLLSEVETEPAVAKRVPSTAAPHLAAAIRRDVMSMLRQPNDHFRCYVLPEIATFTLPAEIEEYEAVVQESLFDDVLDRDVQKELEEGQIINWSLDLMTSRLYALWNRSSGDCLLDSVLQATWGVFDQDNGLRQALSHSLQECAPRFYQRWRDNESSHARLLHFSLNESQCDADWAKLLSIAKKPGSSLEQLHIFVLAHIFRRPIIVYGVKIVKNFRGETLGYAHFEGLYLPFFWESSFCYKSPICLGYTRGHFSALVTFEPDAQLVPGSGPELRPSGTSFLPLTDVHGNLLPIHFLSHAQVGQEELVVREWLDVRYSEGGAMVAAQHIQAPPLLLAQMREEWLGHYRSLL